MKTLRTCNFCKGSEQERMPVAIDLNKRIAGQPVQFTLRPAYTGCPIGCGEPLVNDIGVMKMSTGYDLFIGGKAKGIDAKTGTILLEELQPEQLYKEVEKIIAIYSEHGKRREPFFKFVHRFGKENLKSELVDPLKVKC